MGGGGGGGSVHLTECLGASWSVHRLGGQLVSG